MTLARPSTWPTEMFEVPPVTVRLVRLPPDWFRILAEVVAPTIPPLIVAVPAD